MSKGKRSQHEYRMERGASPTAGASPALDMALNLLDSPDPAKIVAGLLSGSADHSAHDSYGVGAVEANVTRPHTGTQPSVHLGRVTAGTMPRLRDRLVSAVRRPYTAGYIDEFLDRVRHDDPRQARMLTRVNMRATDVIRWLQSGELCFVSDAMTAVCAQAAQSMPPYRLRPDDLPAKVGFMVWADPVAKMNAALSWDGGEMGEAWCFTRAVLWAPCETGAGPGVLATFWADSSALLHSPRYQQAEREQPGLLHNISTNIGPLACYDAVPLPYGVGYDRERNEPVRVRYQPTAALLSTWLIMRQRIAVSTVDRADHPIRLEYRRAHRPEPTVRHIRLRRTYPVGDERHHQARPGSREYHHQWYVAGHWRFADQERYPDKTPTWVSECIRGPEDKPFIGGERVIVLNR